MNSRLVGGVVGALFFSILIGISFLFVSPALGKFNVAAWLRLPFFYILVGSIAGAGLSFRFAFKTKSPNKPEDLEEEKEEVDSHEEPTIMPKAKANVSSENVGLSGALGVVTLLPGTKLQNGSGTTIELAEPCYLWPKFAKSDAPEEPKNIVKKVPRFFERVENRN